MEDEISVRALSRSEAEGHSVRSLLTDYLELAKARLGALVVLTAFVGYVLGARGEGSLSGLAAVVVGTALSSFGANILNQWWESERDSLMLRTCKRPLPAGRLDRRTAAVLGVVTASIGLAILALGLLNLMYPTTRYLFFVYPMALLTLVMVAARAAGARPLVSGRVNQSCSVGWRPFSPALPRMR